MLIRHTRRASVSTRSRTRAPTEGWSWAFGGSYAIRYTIETFSVPTWSRTRARALGGPRAIRYTIGTNYQGRRLDLHQHDAVYKTAALLFGHVGFLVPMPRYITLPTASAAAQQRHFNPQKAGVRGFEPR